MCNSANSVATHGAEWRWKWTKDKESTVGEMEEDVVHRREEEDGRRDEVR